MKRASFGCRIKQAPRSIRSTRIAEVLNCVKVNSATPTASSVASVSLTDQNIASDTRSFSWTVSDTNRLPNPGPLSNAEGQSVTLSMAGTDNVPGDTLTYSAFSLPTGLSINSSTGLVSGIPQYNDASAGLTASYTALVTALDNHFGSDSRTLTWTIADTDRFPSTSAATAVVGVSTSLSMAGTDTIGSDTLTYSATGLPAGLAMNSSTGLISGTPSLSDAIAGSVSLYTASLTLTDNHSGTDHRSLTWYVTNPTFSWSMTPVAAPSVTNPGSQSSAEGAVISLAFHASDPNSYSLTYAALDLPGGLTVNSSTGVIAGTVNYEAANYSGGTYAAQLIVVNGHGGAASAGFAWTISDTILTPTLTSVADQSYFAGDSVSLQVSASDADGNSLTYDTSGLPAGLSIDPTAGLISGSINRAWFRPTPYEVTITVNEGPTASASESFAMSVGVSNHTPTMSSVSNQVNAAGQIVNLSLSAADIDQDPLTYTASGLPSGLSIDPFKGAISGTIDNSAASSTAHIVTVIGSDGQAAVTQSFLWTVNYVGLDSPGDEGNIVGDTVSLALVGYNAGGGPFAYTASGLPAGLSVDSGSGVLSGTLTTAAACSTPYTVTLTADNGVNNAHQTIHWNVARLALDDPGSQYGTEGQSVSLQPTATDVGGTLTWSATNLPAGLSVNSSTGLITGTIGLSAHVSSPFQATLSIQDGTFSATQPVSWNVSPEVGLLFHGPQTNAEGDSVSFALTGHSASGTLTYSASGLPSGVTLNSSSGLISGTLSIGTAQATPYGVTLTAGDGTAQSTTSFNWTVATLELPQLADQHNLDADSVSLAVAAHYHGTGTLTYSADELPTSATLNASTGLISGTLANDADTSGPFDVSVTVNVGSSTVSQTFVWNVDPLVYINPVFDQTNVGGDSVSLTVTATDAASGTLTYSGSGLPSGLTVNSSTGLITGAISSTAVSSTPDTVTITVNDNTLSTSQTFHWSVTPMGFSRPDTQTLVQGQSNSLSLHAWAADGGTITYSATGLPAGLSVNSSTGLISGTPTTVGDALVAVTATEGTHNISVYFEENVLEVGALNPGGQSNREDDTVSLALQANSGSSGSLTFSASGLPDGLGINTSTGLITGTVSTGASGNDTISVAIVDGTQASRISFFWEINQFITISSVSDQINHEADVISLAIVATDAATLSMTYSASGLPGGLSINASTGLISGTISTGDALAGPAEVTVAVTDGLHSGSEVFAWTLAPSTAPAAPSATSIPIQINQTGDEVSLQVLATDSASYTLTYSATNLPDGLNIDPSLGLIDGTIEDDAASTMPYHVSVSVIDGVGETTSASFSWLVNPSPFELSGASLTAVEGTDTGTVSLGSITTPDTNSNAQDFTVSIAWGDGTTGTANVSGENGSFAITGDHVYESTGTHSMSLTVTDSVTNGEAAASGTATVSNVSWTLTGGFEQGVIAGQSATMLVGTIQDGDPALTTSNFSVSITPGDGGSAVAPSFTSIGDGTWALYLTHTYTAGGTYTIGISATGPSATHTASSTAAAGRLYAGIPSVLTSGTLAVVNPPSTSGFTSSIGNGDGGSSTGTISGAGPTFTDSSPYTYAVDSLDETGGTYATSLTVSNGGTTVLSTSSSVAVVRPQLTLNVANLQEDSSGTISSQTVATFTEPDVVDTTSEFSATILWADGTTSAGTITGGNGLFAVSGSHAYSTSGDHAFEVVLNQLWGGSASGGEGGGSSAGPAPAPPPLTVTLLSDHLKGSGVYAVTPDSGGTAYYTGWNNGSTRTPPDGLNPIALLCGGTFTEVATFKVNNTTLLGPLANLYVGPAPGWPAQGNITPSLALAGNKLTATFAGIQIPAVPDDIIGQGIYWSISRTNVPGLIGAGKSVYSFYPLTYKPTDKVIMHDTVVVVGALAAIAAYNSGNPGPGAPTKDQITQQVITSFTTLKITRADGPVAGTCIDGVLQYYNNWSLALDNKTTASLLKTGDGQCNAWCNLFEDVLHSQGIATPNGMGIGIVQVGVPNELMLVNNWSVGTNPPNNTAADNATYPYFDTYPGTIKTNGRSYVDLKKQSYTWLVNPVTKQFGISGQGGTTPLAIFSDHSVAVISENGVTGLFDPSYGNPTYGDGGPWMFAPTITSALLALQNNSLSFLAAGGGAVAGSDDKQWIMKFQAITTTTKTLYLKYGILG